MASAEDFQFVLNYVIQAVIITHFCDVEYIEYIFLVAANDEFSI